MLVTSFVSTPPQVSTHPRPARRRSTSVAAIRRRAAPANPWSTVLIAWLLGGAMLLVCLPAARGNAFLGSTLPFWLVAAPLINLIWMGRRGGRWTLDVRPLMRSLAMRRRAARVSAVRTSARATPLHVR